MNIYIHFFQLVCPVFNATEQTYTTIMNQHKCFAAHKIYVHEKHWTRKVSVKCKKSTLSIQCLCLFLSPTCRWSNWITCLYSFQFYNIWNFPQNKRDSKNESGTPTKKTLRTLKLISINKSRRKVCYTHCSARFRHVWLPLFMQSGMMSPKMTIKYLYTLNIMKRKQNECHINLYRGSLFSSSIDSFFICDFGLIMQVKWTYCLYVHRISVPLWQNIKSSLKHLPGVRLWTWCVERHTHICHIFTYEKKCQFFFFFYNKKIYSFFKAHTRKKIRC